MEKMTLALLAGGMSSEREVSLNSGDQVYEALDKQKYNIVRYDPKTDLARLVEDAPGIDAALIILHGPYGRWNGSGASRAAEHPLSGFKRSGQRACHEQARFQISL